MNGPKKPSVKWMAPKSLLLNEWPSKPCVTWMVLKSLVLNEWPYPNYFSFQTLSFVRPSPVEKKSEGGSTLCLKLKHVCISDKKSSLTFLWDNIQGYPQRMRLQRRLYKVETVCFLVFLILCNLGSSYLKKFMSSLQSRPLCVTLNTE